jgi:hypothetical protein
MTKKLLLPATLLVLVVVWPHNYVEYRSYAPDGQSYVEQSAPYFPAGGNQIALYQKGETAILYKDSSDSIVLGSGEVYWSPDSERVAVLFWPGPIKVAWSRSQRRAIEFSVMEEEFRAWLRARYQMPSDFDPFLLLAQKDPKRFPPIVRGREPMIIPWTEEANKRNWDTVLRVDRELRGSGK